MEKNRMQEVQKGNNNLKNWQRLLISFIQQLILPNTVLSLMLYWTIWLLHHGLGFHVLFSEQEYKIIRAQELCYILYHFKCSIQHLLPRTRINTGSPAKWLEISAPGFQAPQWTYNSALTCISTTAGHIPAPCLFYAYLYSQHLANASTLQTINKYLIDLFAKDGESPGSLAKCKSQSPRTNSLTP